MIVALLVLSSLAACGGESPADTPGPTAVDEASRPTDVVPLTPTDHLGPLGTGTPTPTDAPSPTAYLGPLSAETATLSPSSTPLSYFSPISTGTGTPAPDGTSAPVDEPTPSDYVSPISTGTGTPAPTAPSRPTPGPLPTQEPAQPDVPPEVMHYVQNLQTLYGPFPDAVRSLNGLLQAPRPDDAAWVGAMEGQVQNFKGLYETIRDLDAPAQLLGTHTAISNALGTCNGVADVALEGFRKQDQGLLLETGNMAKACVAQLRGALGLLGEFGVSFEVPAIEIPQGP